MTCVARKYVYIFVYMYYFEKSVLNASEFWQKWDKLVGIFLRPKIKLDKSKFSFAAPSQACINMVGYKVQESKTLTVVELVFYSLSFLGIACLFIWHISKTYSLQVERNLQRLSIQMTNAMMAFSSVFCIDGMINRVDVLKNGKTTVSCEGIARSGSFGYIFAKGILSF